MKTITSAASLLESGLNLETATFEYLDLGYKFHAIEMTGLERDVYDTVYMTRVRQPKLGVGQTTLDMDRLRALLVVLGLCGETPDGKPDGKRLWDTSLPQAALLTTADDLRKKVPGRVLKRLAEDLATLNKLNERAEKAIEKN